MTTLTQNQKDIIGIVIILALCELFSFFSYLYHPLGYVIAAAIIILAIVMSVKDLFYGFLIIIIELLIGSQGYLFSIAEEPNRISLRIGLWTAVMVVWISKELIGIYKSKRLPYSIKIFPYLKPLGLLLISIAVAALIGYLRGNEMSFIIDEGKRWAYLIFIVPFFTLCASSEKRRWLLVSLAAAGFWIAIKSFGMLFIFSHEMPLLDHLYMWTRSTLLGEITRLPNKFTRVFLQSQVFVIPAFFISIGFFVKKAAEQKWHLTTPLFKNLIASSFFFCVILISLSRSFWVGTALGLFFGLSLAFIYFRPNMKHIGAIALYGASVALLSAILLIIAVRFPFPRPTSDLSTSILTDRATEFEAGAASRWSLLPVMKNAILEQPIFGQGLGKSLSYISSDPRVRQNDASGLYTTHAFEWGWLDLWMKLGLLGLGAYLWLLYLIVKSTFRLIRTRPHTALPAIASLVALIALNFFTPYLNHPLGFGYLAMLMVLSKPESGGLA